MASISKERLREMEEEMDRFEAEIQVPGGPPIPPFILGANTYDKVQAQLSSLRQESSRLQKRGRRDEDSDEDEDLRHLNAKFIASRKQNYEENDDENEFHDIDERPGRPQGPILPPPPPPPPPPPVVLPPGISDMNLFAPPPPPPPPEPDVGDNESGQSTLSFKPYAPGEGPHIPRPAFMPPQLRHRMPPPGLRPPFMRPPMRMGMPPVPFGGPMGFARQQHMMGMGPQMGPMNPVGHPVPSIGVSMPPGPQIVPPGPPGVEPGGLQFMTPTMEGSQSDIKPSLVDQPKVVYSAAPVITVEIKREEKKKKKKKKKGLLETASGEAKSRTGLNSKDSTGPDGTSHSSITTSVEEDKSVMDMEIVPESALVGGIMTATMTPEAALASAAASGNPQGAPGTGVPGKKEKKKKEKKFLRLAANTTWEDPTLSDWQQDDFRMFCGDLGNEVTDETLVRAFNKYPTFLKAKVIRDRRTNKTRGYGFVSFKDPLDFTRAMREMNGKYVGNRPIKLRKSSWKDRSLEVVRKKDKEKKRLGLR